MVLDHDKDFGLGEFLSQRYHYSRSYAGMRNESLGRRRWLYALGAPLLPPVLYWRIARNVFARGRRPAGVRARDAAHPPLRRRVGGGEAVGYAFGGGRSLLKVR